MSLLPFFIICLKRLFQCFMILFIPVYLIIFIGQARFGYFSNLIEKDLGNYFENLGVKALTVEKVTPPETLTTLKDNGSLKLTSNEAWGFARIKTIEYLSDTAYIVTLQKDTITNPVARYNYKEGTKLLLTTFGGIVPPINSVISYMKGSKYNTRCLDKAYTFHARHISNFYNFEMKRVTSDRAHKKGLFISAMNIRYVGLAKGTIFARSGYPNIDKMPIISANLYKNGTYYIRGWEFSTANNALFYTRNHGFPTDYKTNFDMAFDFCHRAPEVTYTNYLRNEIVELKQLKESSLKIKNLKLNLD